MTDYDDTFLGKLIIAAENPDSIGFDKSNKKWYSPKLKGYDKDNFGVGVDRKTANDYLRKDSKGEYLTEKDEKYLRNESIAGAITSLGNRDKFIENTLGLENKSSENTKNKVISYIYNMGGSNVANSAFNEKLNNATPSIWYDFINKYINDDFEGVSNSINQSYLNQGKKERVKNENNYFLRNKLKNSKKTKYSYLEFIKNNENNIIDNIFNNPSK